MSQQGFELFDWLTALYGVWKGLNEDTVYLSSLVGMGELLKSGCTTVFDHHYVFPANAGDLLGAQVSAAEHLGVTPAAAYAALSRLTEQEKLVRVGGKYYLAGTVVPPEEPTLPEGTGM